MISRNITFFGKSCTLACDAKCSKAWGHNNRPKIILGPEEWIAENVSVEDFVWLADDELGEAPEDPGTYEGGQAKPCTESERLNKWCARECERSEIVVVGEPVVLPDFSKRIYNIPERHLEAKE